MAHLETHRKRWGFKKSIAKHGKGVKAWSWSPRHASPWVTFRRQLNGAFGFELSRQHISSLPWVFRACWTGLKISTFQCLVGVLRSQTRDGLITPQCISGWILLPKTELFQNDLWNVKPGDRPVGLGSDEGLRGWWRLYHVSWGTKEAVHFSQGKEEMQIKGKQSRCLPAVLYRVLKSGVRLRRVKGYI